MMKSGNKAPMILVVALVMGVGTLLALAASHKIADWAAGGPFSAGTANIQYNDTTSDMILTVDDITVLDDLIIGDSLTVTGALGVASVTATGTVSAEQLTSTDDASVADDLTVSGHLKSQNIDAATAVDLQVGASTASSVTIARSGANTTVSGHLIVVGTRLSVANLPTSANGLSSGDVWLNSNVLTVVP